MGRGVRERVSEGERRLWQIFHKRQGTKNAWGR